MEETNVRGLYLTERLKNYAYNFKYKAVALVEEYNKQSIIGSYQDLYLLGTKYASNPSNLEKINREIFQEFRKIIWITYRSGFPQLISSMESNQSFVTDTGWGCMIRVGQMMFAEILRTHTQAKNQSEITAIVQEFNDFTVKALFSIQKIAKRGNKQFNLKPGEWYNPSQIAYILKDMLDLQQTNKKYQNLTCIVFNNGNLFFDQILKEVVPKASKCEHKDQKLICAKCNKAVKSIAIIVLIRIGLEKPEPKYLQILNQMLESRFFRGMLGGKPSKALYFVGKHENDYVYLDPHYVQEAVVETKSSQNSYFCQSFRKCSNTSIDPSLGVCFYVRDLEELNLFHQEINKWKSLNEEFFIFVSDRTPSYAKVEKRKVESQNKEDEEEFQAL